MAKNADLLRELETEMKNFQKIEAGAFSYLLHAGFSARIQQKMLTMEHFLQR